MTIFERLQVMLSTWLSFPGSTVVISIIYIILVAACAVAGYYITIWILRGVAYLVGKSKTTWDDDIINQNLLKALSQLAPAVIVAILLPQWFGAGKWFFGSLRLLTYFYIIWVSVYAINTFLDNLLYAFSQRPRFKAFAVKGIFQMGKLVCICIGIIIAISLMLERSPIAIVTTLGASAAILMLVFKDTIMGLVASVQLTANKMVHKGDWVVVPKHDANGEVIDISLTTVKIRNWDNSVTTVPPYSLISDSFQNYQAMRRAKARRIRRSIFIDFNSIRFLTDDEIDALKANGLFQKRKEPVKGIAKEGKKKANKESAEEAPKETPQEAPMDTIAKTEKEVKKINLSLFRDYLEYWLAENPNVREDLLLMVRQLDPQPSGLPLDIYCFVKATEWKAFEHLQSDIFDHIYATAPRFGLTIFQSPSGLDLKSLK